MTGFSQLSYDEVGGSYSFPVDTALLFKPADSRLADNHDATTWHSAPLAFALFPALAGLLFHNGGAIATDLSLLVLTGVFLNWSVTVPWECYQDSRSLRVEESSDAQLIDQGRETDKEVPSARTDEPPAHLASPTSADDPGTERGVAIRSAAEAKMRRNELLALLSCFVLPLASAWLLHAIRSQLSRPSEGLVSNYNLTIFVLASQFRPMTHLFRMIRTRTLHLQRAVHADKLQHLGQERIVAVDERLDALEAQVAAHRSSRRPSDPEGTDGGVASVTAEVRRGVQPEVDALNRAVRRYEKRATVQAMQTEARLQELEARVNDAVSLAAAAVQARQEQSRSYGRSMWELIYGAWTLPLWTLVTIFSLPAKLSTMTLAFGRALMRLGKHGQDAQTADGRYRADGRVRDRSHRRASKRPAQNSV